MTYDDNWVDEVRRALVACRVFLVRSFHLTRAPTPLLHCYPLFITFQFYSVVTPLSYILTPPSSLAICTLLSSG